MVGLDYLGESFQPKQFHEFPFNAGIKTQVTSLVELTPSLLRGWFFSGNKVAFWNHPAQTAWIRVLQEVSFSTSNPTAQITLPGLWFSSQGSF